MHLTTAHTEADERDAATTWLRTKLWDGTAGLDPDDPAVIIVEVSSPEKAWRLDLIGQPLSYLTHVRPDLSTCLRVRAILEADVRVALRLDEPGAPTLRDRPLVAAHHDAPGQILDFDRSRRAGRSWSR